MAPTIADDVTEETAPSAVQRAQGKLTEAVLSGSDRRIKRAQAALEAATVAEAREADRARALADATQRAAQQTREKQRAAKRERADAAEARLREQTPTVTFEVGDKRLVVLMSVEAIEYGWSVECIRRISWAIAREFSDRVVRTRSAGEVVGPTDFLTGLMSDHTNGIALHLKRGVVRVEPK